MQSNLAEKCPRGRALGEEPVAATVIAGTALLGCERFEVSLVFELLPGVVRPRMACDFGRAVEHAYHRARCDDGERSPDMCMWNRVVVSVEPYVGRFAGDDSADEIGRSGVLRKRKKASALLGEGVADDTFLEVAGNETSALNAVNPNVELLVEVLDGPEGAGGKEGVT